LFSLYFAYQAADGTLHKKGKGVVGLTFGTVLIVVTEGNKIIGLGNCILNQTCFQYFKSSISCEEKFKKLAGTQRINHMVNLKNDSADLKNSHVGIRLDSLSLRWEALFAPILIKYLYARFSF
jgi:hypothetical protein